MVKSQDLWDLNSQKTDDLIVEVSMEKLIRMIFLWKQIVLKYHYITKNGFLTPNFKRIFLSRISEKWSEEFLLDKIPAYCSIVLTTVLLNQILQGGDWKNDENENIKSILQRWEREFMIKFKLSGVMMNAFIKCYHMLI